MLRLICSLFLNEKSSNISIRKLRSPVSAMVSVYFFCHHVDFFVDFFVEFYVDFFVDFFVKFYVDFFVDFFVEFYVDSFVEFFADIFVEFFVASYVGFHVGFLTTCSTRWRGMQVWWTRWESYQRNLAIIDLGQGLKGIT